MSGRLAFTFARMNPPTTGHEHVVNVLKGIWAHDRRIYLSGSHDAKNPLSFERKHELVSKAFQDIDVIVSEIPQKDFFTTLQFVGQLGYSEIDVLVGSDRIDELKKRIPMYNGKLYHFVDIKIHCAGNRVDGAAGVPGMSASKLREAAKLNDYETFEDGLPLKLRHMSRDIFEEIQESCQSRDLVSSI